MLLGLLIVGMSATVVNTFDTIYDKYFCLPQLTIFLSMGFAKEKSKKDLQYLCKDLKLWDSLISAVLKKTLHTQISITKIA